MIMGPQVIHTVALLPEEGPEATAKFEATVQGLEDYIVFADGRTPCNTIGPLDP